jgi:Fe-S oxidoreductase
MMSIKGDYKPIPFIEDAAVPVEYLAEYVTSIEKFCNDIGTRVAYYAHASAGCIHIRPLINAKIAAEVEKLPVISSFALELLGRFGGSLSSEHGDGRARSWQNERFFGSELYQLYHRVKTTFDPQGILNPGNIIDAPPMTETLRYGEDYFAQPHKEHLSFTSDHGFMRAVEMCNGAGICRKRTEGTMCPSFMATREEADSTRGRANALRAALSGALPYEELISERMFEVMDLCIECKACKAECPSSVDMAKIKTEFLATYYDHHQLPLRSRLFADIGFVSRMLSGPLASGVNWLLSLSVVKELIARFGGISAARTLPPFSSRPFPAWARQHGLYRQPDESQDRPVLLFVDTFNNFNTPEIAFAATEVLQQAGFAVMVTDYGCCGRPMLSKGLVRRARAAARATVDRLATWARSGIPIVGLEPSCVSAIRDDYRSLLPEDPDVAMLADHVETFDEFVAKEHSKGNFHLDLNRRQQRLLLHGHCHQKALIGNGPSRQTLSLTGAEVTEVDSGCCGMAGSFGYEAEHYDVSMTMAERRLLPAVRSMETNCEVVAAGTSCRHQIVHGTGRRALHPAEVLQAALKNRSADFGTGGG